MTSLSWSSNKSISFNGKVWFLRRPEWEWWEAHQMEEKVTVSPQYWVSSFGIFQVECHDLDVFEFGDMEKTRPVMGKWWIRIKCNTRAHLNTITLLYQGKKFASLQSISPLIQIWLSSGASETSCATNTIVYQMSTSVNQHTNWIGSEKVVLGLHVKWNLYLQVWTVDSTQKSSIQVKLII